MLTLDREAMMTSAMAAVRANAAAPPVRILIRLVGVLILKPSIGQSQSYHAQPERRLGNRMDKWMNDVKKGAREKTLDPVSHLCHTEGPMLFCLLEGM